MNKKALHILFVSALCCVLPAMGQKEAWQWRGPERLPTFEGKGQCPNGMGLVSALFVDPGYPDVIFAGSNTGGLFRSDNGGMNWRNISDSSMPMVTGISSIVRDPLDPQRYYIGTGTSSYDREYGLGVWRSDDGGENWIPTGLHFRPEEKDGIRASVKKLLIHPADPSILYAFVRTTAYAAVYRTMDHGVSWKEVLRKEGEFFFDAEFAPGNPETIYIGGKNLWYSHDGGETWMQSTMDSPGGEVIHRVAVSVHPEHPSRVWTLYETNGRRGIVLARSNDRGANWRTVSITSPGQLSVGQWKMEFSISPSDTSVFYAGGIYMHRSRDYGKSFQTITTSRLGTPQWMHVDVRSMLVFPGMSSDIIYAGHDGGVSVSADGGGSWMDVSGEGLGITQFWGITYDHRKKRVYGGTQDLGLLMYDGSGWANQEIYGDVYDGVVQPIYSDTLLMLVNSGSPGLRRSTDGGQIWKYVNQPYHAGRNDRPLAYSPASPETVYMGLHDVRVSKDFGLDWSNISNFSKDFGVPEWENLVALAAAPSDPKVVYAAYGGATWSNEPQGKIFRTRDQGQSWDDISGNLVGIRWTGVTDIKVSAENADEVWVSVDGFWGDDDGTVYKVFHSTDGGVNWENVSQGLPNFPVNCLLLLPEHRLVLAGTDAGVWSAPLKGGSWEEWNRGMPRTIVSDLETDPGNTHVFASTFGRGLYELRMPVQGLKEKKRGSGDNGIRKRRFLFW